MNIEAVKILITGDLFISDKLKNEDLIDQSILTTFGDSEYNIVNLESPITENIHKNKIVKTGPHLRSDRSTTIPILERLNVNIVTLSNNHIFDYGKKGIEDTFQTLDENKIKYVGAGRNIAEASRILTLEKNGVKIALLNFAENEWSTTHGDYAGANPLDIIDNVHQIKVAHKTHDKVIVIIHGGHEYYNLPSPRMVKQYRFYAENGADLIVGHHPHCIGGVEIHKGTPIFYSLGNFLFTLPSKRSDWFKGLILELVIKRNEPIKYEVIPVKQNEKDFRLSLMKGIDASKSLEQHKHYSGIISNDEQLMDQWLSYVLANSKRYTYVFSPLKFLKYRLFRSIVIRLKLYKLFIGERYLSAVLNNIRCEAHHDLAVEVLKMRTKQS